MDQVEFKHQVFKGLSHGLVLVWSDHVPAQDGWVGLGVNLFLGFARKGDVLIFGRLLQHVEFEVVNALEE